jgi:hypothetical protein
MKCEDIIKRFNVLEAERKGDVESVWEHIERFVLPFRGEFYSLDGSTSWQKRHIYDSTAVTAAQSLAASMHGNLTSPSNRWFDLRFRDEKLNRKKKAKQWLEESGKAVFNALQDSNFNIEVSETYIDLSGYGTSGIVEEYDEEKEEILFQSVPLKEFFFEEDYKGQVYRLYRRLHWETSKILTKFGEENMPEWLMEEHTNPQSGNKKHEIIFCIYLRPEKAGADITKPLAPLERPIGFKYVMKKGAEELQEGGYYEMPAFVPRWRKTNGSRWGNSPAMSCLADIMTLNEMVATVLEATAKAVDPPSLATERGLLSDLDLTRGGLTMVRSLDGVKPYESGARIDWGSLQIDRLQRSIDKCFMIDQLEMKESPAMTATEVNVRYELMQRLLGPVLGRLQSDFLDPLIQRTFNILLRAGKLPPLPNEIEAGQIDIQYSGPLPRAQRQDEAIAIQNWAMLMAQLAQVFPESLDVVDPEKMAQEIGTLMGVPASIMRSEEEMQQVEDAKNAAKQKAEGMAQAEQLARSGEAMQSIGTGAEAMTGLMAGGMGE